MISERLKLAFEKLAAAKADLMSIS